MTQEVAGEDVLNLEPPRRKGDNWCDEFPALLVVPRDVVLAVATAANHPLCEYSKCFLAVELCG